MIRIVLILFIAVSAYALDTCYTVQLISKYNSNKNLELLSAKDYESSCKVMEIGKSITVRCGCFDKFIDAKKSLSKYNQEYKKAAVTTTYKYRFDDLKELDEPVVEKLTEAQIEVVKPAVVNNIQEPKPRKQQSETITKVEIIEPFQKVETINHVAVIEEETVKVQKKKKKKKKKKKVTKKKKKKKFVKKRDAQYVYDPYIGLLRNDTGIGYFDYRYKFGAQLSYDISLITEENAFIGSNHYTENDWRRIRVYHKGSFFNEKLFYELEYSFTGNNKYKDVYLGYTDNIKMLNTKYRFKSGNIKIPFSLESYTSSKYVTFMERALNDSFTDGRKIGAELLLSTKLSSNRINLFVAAFSNSIDEKIDDEVEQPGFSTRLTYAYKFTKRHLISVGGAYLSQDMKGENVRFNQSSESEYIEEKYVSVKIKDVDKKEKKNIEALYINNKFSLQAEYTTVLTEALKDDYNFNGYYFEGSYFILGKGKRYKFGDSTLGKIRPNKDGALELAFRYSYLDLNDKDEYGGTQVDYNYGVNWYYSPQLKFMFNYIIANPSDTDDYDGRLQILQSRVLFAF